VSVAAALVLRSGDESRLSSLVRSSTVEAGLAQRARIVLLAAQGVPNAEIARRVGVSRPTVIQWRNRYEAGGISALGDLDRSGRPPVIDDVAVVVATVQAPPEALGVTHWSARLLGKHLGISFASVARIWREWNLQPWRRETFKFSTDPELDAKVRDVVALYLNPPDKAVVVCIDEKSQIQALDRTARTEEFTNLAAVRWVPNSAADTACMRDLRCMPAAARHARMLSVAEIAM
jgi:transposase